MSHAPDHPADVSILSTRLKPHRSMTVGQFHILLLAVGAGGIVATIPFVVMGAWPVAGFMGLDVLAVYFAFRSNFRAARAYEDVNLTVLELTIAKVSAKGHKAEWRFNPSWVRLKREEHEEFGTLRLDIVSKGRSLEIAAFLGPDQKAAFAERLSRGLAQARAGMRF